MQIHSAIIVSLGSVYWLLHFRSILRQAIYINWKLSVTFLIKLAKISILLLFVAKGRPNATLSIWRDSSLLHALCFCFCKV